MMKPYELYNQLECNWRTAIVGLLKICAILTVAISIILGVLIFAFNMAHDPDYEIKAWCNEFHPELSFNDCLDEAGV